MSAQRFVSESAKEKYHFVYVDPPFDFIDSEVEDLLGKLHTEGFLKVDAMVAVERTTRGSKFSWPGAFTPLRQRKYGAATIYYGNYAP
jgi:16S rRNA (guanine966-N2)-methyltransferase